MALVDSVQQGHDMLANELFALKPGTFIKGFDILPSDNWSGRRAVLSTEGWTNKSDYKLFKVRTVLFVTQPNLLSGEDCINATKNNYAWDNYQSNLFDDYADMGFVSFNENEPIVCNPIEAFNCFLRTNMDILVLNNYIFSRTV